MSLPIDTIIHGECLFRNKRYKMPHIWDGYCYAG